MLTQPIAALVEHDGADGLLTALAAFLRCNGHVEGAAAELGVHRHTMRNRIAKISALTRHDLNDADTRGAAAAGAAGPGAAGDGRSIAAVSTVGQSETAPVFASGPPFPTSGGSARIVPLHPLSGGFAAAADRCGDGSRARAVTLYRRKPSGRRQGLDP